MIGNEYDNLDIYKLNIKQTLDKKKIFLIIIGIIFIICLIITTIHVINIIQRHKVFKQYENQIIALHEAEEESKRKFEEERERIRQERLPNLTQEGKDNIKNIYQSEEKRVFLTFDDGPSAITAQILDILKQEEVKATFFVLGSQVELMPETTKRIYEEGHYIANHGYSHVYTQIYQSPEAVYQEYVQCNEAVRKAIGEDTYDSHLFRFPGGLVGGKYQHIKTAANEILEQNNITHVDWNALNGDSEKKEQTVEYQVERVKQTVGNKNSVVILMHDAKAKELNVEALPHIISFFKEQGYTFENFYKIIK